MTATAATRNLFDRPELLENQTRLILSADAKPRRLIRSATRSAGQHGVRERSDSVGSGSVIPEADDDDETFNDQIESKTHGSQLIREGSIGNEEINYDTDIEQDAEITRDFTCKGLYLEQCHRYGVIPSTHFLRHLNDETLEIPYTGLKPIHIKVMVPALRMNSTITKLDLRDNSLGSRGAIYIAQILRDNEYIDELNLADNSVGLHGCGALCRVLCNNRSMRKINLEGNRLNDDCALSLSQVFSQNEYITHMNLNKNQFENEATGRLFGQSLGENQTLEEVQLNWNRFNSKALGHLLKPLANNARMTLLDVSWNGGGLFTAKAAGEMLKKNTVLEFLHLDNNRFDTECAVLIGRGLAKNTTLKVLTITGNGFESSGCYGIVSPLLKHPASVLQLIDLRGYDVNQDFTDLVELVRPVLPNLTIQLQRKSRNES